VSSNAPIGRVAAEQRIETTGAPVGRVGAKPRIETTPYGPDDAMGRLWVPHRMMYIQGADKPPTPKSTDCPFCDPVICQGFGVGDAGRLSSDEVASVETTNALKDKLVVARGEHCFVILNLFPYNSGHMLVLPYRHTAELIDLTEPEALEFHQLTNQAIIAARQAMNPQGFNLGINQGAVAGAGIAAHLHQHVVPRWTGDANFLPIIGQTKAMPQFLADTRNQLAANWPGAGAIC